MSIRHVLAVAPVSDLDRAERWYEALFGVRATNHPMPSLVEWRLPDAGWVQVYVDPEHAGGTALNLAVDDLDATRTEIAARGIELGDVIEANKGVRLGPLTDPDGNTITLIGGFREEY